MSLSPAFSDQLFTRKLFAFAGDALLVYDYLITFSLEVTYIWDAPWTMVKALFLINRYGTLIGQTFIMFEETGHLSRGSEQFCRAHKLFLAFFAVLSGESIRLLVVMRACAILRCKHSIAVLANTLYVLCAMVIVGVSYYWLRDIESVHFKYLSDTGICFGPMPTYAWLLWLIPLCLDGFVFVIISFSLYRLTRWSRGHYSSRLTRLLARDSFLFYFAALFNVLFYMACWTFYREDPRNALAELITFPLLSIVGQRLVLNLRRLRVRPDSASDLSREIHRQMAAMGDSDDPQPGSGLELAKLGEKRAV